MLTKDRMHYVVLPRFIIFCCCFILENSYFELMGRAILFGLCFKFCRCHFFHLFLGWFMPHCCGIGRVGGKGSSTWADWDLATMPWLHTPLWTCQLMLVYVCVRTCMCAWVCVCVFMRMLDWDEMWCGACRQCCTITANPRVPWGVWFTSWAVTEDI